MSGSEEAADRTFTVGVGQCENTAMLTTRRLFLGQAVHPLAICLASAVKHRAAPNQFRLSVDDLATFRNDLLARVNAERLLAGASALKIDELACQVADQHALDMVTGKFLSHWGTDGRKPYHRYCRAGGFHAVQENVSAAGYLEARNLKYIGLTLAQMHMRMYEEFPPNDGHRRTILAPQHTHVGFGIALADDDLRLVELYVGKHVYLEPYPKQAKKKATLRLGGKPLNPGYQISYAEIFYEPPPTPPSIDWLRTPRPYALPEEYRTVRPIAPEGTTYADGVKGEIEIGNRGSFRIPVRMFKNEPGIYTVVIWISNADGRMSLAATNACIEVE